MAETKTAQPEIGSQRAFNYFSNTHPNNEKGPGRHRAMSEKSRHRAENNERRTWRERAAAVRKLGGKAMDFGFNAVARTLYGKEVVNHVNALYAEHEQAAQAEHALRQQAETVAPIEQPVVSEVVAGHDDHELGERDSALRVINDVPEKTYAARVAAPEAGDPGIQAAIHEFDGVVDHAEQLATDGDVLVDPGAEVVDADLPTPRVGDGENDSQALGRVEVRYENASGAEIVAAEPAVSETRLAEHRRRSKQETYAESLARRRAYAGHHAEQYDQSADSAEAPNAGK